mmetsp:Transcript_34305/g.82953  ORF Transcript_34305/g.82953 Transcript_34305/m.82953 type:complete len:620 (+) Transcript_34305:141-2000(+)
MLRSGFARRVAQRTAVGVIATGAAGTAALAVYANTERGLGFKREAEFWSRVSPVVFDYWWNSFSSSPKVKLRAALTTQAVSEEGGRDDDDDDDARRKAQLNNELHERNAPKIFRAMLDLGGLYIKLGQVLSVTAIPVPEQYRTLFRTLQSNVPGASDFGSVVRPTLEEELGVASLDDVFESVDEIPCGAASIGQAHRAVLRSTGEEVVIKVQYPEAIWQVPADIECVGQFLQICVHFGLVDETSSKLSYEEFSRQFLAELDYARETENLKLVYRSSLDPNAPYMKRGVVIPRVFDELCTNRVITMTYFPGPKFEEEARQQLKVLGIDTKGGIRSLVKEAHDNTTNINAGSNNVGGELALSPESHSSWKSKISRVAENLVSVDMIFSIVRFTRRVTLWSTAAAVKSIQAVSVLPIVPSDWKTWADERQNAIQQAERWGWTQEAITALLDVHGYQILNQGLFNADPHPGNILVVQDETNPSKRPKIGLIDYGQVKRLEPEERVRVAKLILSIADKESDEVIAGHFRNLGIKTKSDSTRFLADFGRLMFGCIEAKHFSHEWHKNLHKEDRILYFPNELSMVYRTSLLLRGLAMSLQFNPSVGEKWRHHAEETIKLHCADQVS